MEKLSNHEISTLDDLKYEGYKYLARDADGTLNAYMMKPAKIDKEWVALLKDSQDMKMLSAASHFVKLVSFDDKEPTLISELIEEYTNTGDDKNIQDNGDKHIQELIEINPNDSLELIEGGESEKQHSMSNRNTLEQSEPIYAHVLLVTDDGYFVMKNHYHKTFVAISLDNEQGYTKDEFIDLFGKEDFRKYAWEV